MDSKKYNNIKLAAGIIRGILSFALILLFVWLGISRELAGFITENVAGRYLQFLLFVIISGSAASVIFFPLSFYTDFYLEHKYGLSNQSFAAWIGEGLKAMLVSAVIGIPLLLFFYYALNRYQSSWWLPFAIILFILSVVLARIVPVLIMPLFYKITPLENDELKERLEIMASETGLKLKSIFKFNMSKNTKKANAAFTGMGKTKRILLGDTLLDSYSNDEIETVIAHEMGHYKYRHILKNIFIGTISSFLSLYLMSVLYEVSLEWFGFYNIAEIAALPLLSLWAMLVGIIQTPISASISRKYEYEADEYAVSLSGKAEAFKRTLEKLNQQNLGDKEPHPFVEWFFYSHPSVKKRIARIDTLSDVNPGI